MTFNKTLSVEKGGMYEFLLSSPFLYGISQWLADHKPRTEEEAGDRPHDDSGERLYGESASSESAAVGVLVWVIVIGLICVFGVVPLAKAFQCGPNTTALGLTGTTWGVIILVSLLVAPWIFGLFLGALYLTVGRCAISSLPVEEFISERVALSPPSGLQSMPSSTFSGF